MNVVDPQAPRLSPLAALEAQVRQDLERVAYPAPLWVPPRTAGGAPVLDVAIVGGGQGGLGAAFGLMRERIVNIRIFDRGEPGLEGPWVTFARMLTLRTPKHVTGPDGGIPSLTPQSWFEARYGAEAWETLDKISRHDWQDYLRWFRAVLSLPVQNHSEVVDIEPATDDTGDRILRLSVLGPDGPQTHYTRKVVLATGIAGSGRWQIPASISQALPEDRYAHTAAEIDFERLRGARIAVLGAGASAFDNAATALEGGAGSVTLCLRRRVIPSVNPYRWMEQAGFLGHHAELPDRLRWEFMRHIFDLNQPPPQDTFWRCRRHTNFSFRTGAPFLDIRMQGNEVIATLPEGELAFDFLIVGTGFEVDFAQRPETARFAGQIALWRDRYTPEPGSEHALLGTYPYLGDAFQFVERDAGAAPELADIHNFTFGATPSMGLSGASISGMKYGVARLVSGIARDLYRTDAERHLVSLRAYETPELTSLDPPVC
ncbi:cation diffusion facilitator CzcD-associated flavoprotein CzcO [Endobacter medicaginis]|uniref:Cation diffusion facilitator CzcD-associated flavoprotein CzcO n=1 Tax=Endobacter medicaginis TaxID=1181271 RepID=A0A839URF4_9PROT|nr:NAD(P)/FAD-dependent oxidoreductase [Endobacter medicaginis]MBB3172788.1 cation diffusion facilitator CzcD-associated flavoprotein CzcO [Endobacter medicaginis]MCX5474395.1 NAD(P)/FAD-dependent oxidoreductase [Endobacter medicaginis]NVN29222.1 NAD(P)/FAD-dependent oxidoreductase [Endobacter medicaginis]